MTGEQPVLRTARLLVRPFTLEDAPTVQSLAGAREIADTTLNIPHPYPDGGAEQWIGTHPRAWQENTGATYAIEDAATGALVGAVGLTIALEHSRAELGYWVGVPYWNRGYCTEASRSLVDLAFDALQLNRVQARHLTRNPASGRVMQKLGMSLEGIHRESMRKWDRLEDIAMYAILARDRSPAGEE